VEAFKEIADKTQLIHVPSLSLTSSRIFPWLASHSTLSRSALASIEPTTTVPIIRRTRQEFFLLCSYVLLLLPAQGLEIQSMDPTPELRE
jgi:hypothetical protein